MESWRDRFDAVAEVRGLGAMLAIALERAGSPTPISPPRSPRARRAAASCSSRRASTRNCIRVLVPLVIEDAELAEALDVWEDALTEALAG